MPNNPDTNPVSPAGKPTGSEKPTEAGEIARSNVPVERKSTKRSGKLQGGFPPLPQTDLIDGPSITITEHELTEIPAPFITVGEDGIARTFRSITEIVRKRKPVASEEITVNAPKPGVPPEFPEFMHAYKLAMTKLVEWAPKAQQLGNRLRTLADRINSSEDPDEINSLLSLVDSFMQHSSNDPKEHNLPAKLEDPKSTPKYPESVLKDPMAFIMLGITMVAENTKIPIPEMSPATTKKIALLRRELYPPKRYKRRIFTASETAQEDLS
jgi:hypothetical protein